VADGTADDVFVRVMRPGEYDRVRALEVAAFGDDESIGALLDLLRGSWTWEDEMSFVAELVPDAAAADDGEVVAHVLYTHAIVDAPDRLVDVLLLSPVGVRPDHHGLGIGTRLITETLQLLAATRHEPLVFLEGDPRYYTRFGFVAAGDRGFRAPSLRIPPPAFQLYPLPADDGSLTGTLVYPDAFWRTDSVGLR
jgi:putative acetyltransferase